MVTSYRLVNETDPQGRECSTLIVEVEDFDGLVDERLYDAHSPKGQELLANYRYYIPHREVRRRAGWSTRHPVKAQAWSEAHVRCRPGQRAERS